MDNHRKYSIVHHQITFAHAERTPLEGLLDEVVPLSACTQLQLQNVLCALLRQTIEPRCQRHRQEHATARRRYLEHVELDRQHLAQQPQHSS